MLTHISICVPWIISER